MEELKYRGLEYKTVEDLLQCGVMGFCGCGAPKESLYYIRRGLELIGEKPPEHIPWGDWYTGYRKRVKEHFKTGGAEYFFYYWCDAGGLTEHGGAVPGWLSATGDELLEALKKLPEENA